MKNETMRRIRVALCDYDDCLAETELVALTVACMLTNRLLREYGKESYSVAEFLERFPGTTYREILHITLRERGFQLEETEIERLVIEERDEVIAALGRELNPCEGANEMLASLHREGFTLAVVSSSAHARLRACLERTGQMEYFDWDNVFSAQSSLNPPSAKPKPDIYLHAMSKLEVEPDACIVLEDSRAGVMSASRAGIKHILGYLGALPEEKQLDRARLLLDSGALGVLQHMRDVQEAIELLESERMEEFEGKFVLPYTASE